jgi:hypothetical protein
MGKINYPKQPKTALFDKQSDVVRFMTPGIAENQMLVVVFLLIIPFSNSLQDLQVLLLLFECLM